MIAPLRLYRLTGTERLALVSVAPGTAAGTWLVRLARGAKQGKLTSGSVFGPFPEGVLAARFDEVVAQLKAEGFLASGSQRLIAQLSEKGSKKRAAAAQRLGWMRSREAVDALISSLESAGDEATALIDALGEIGDPKAISAVRPWAERQLLARRRSAVEALRKLGDPTGLKGARARALERLPDAVRAVVALDKEDPTPVALVKAVWRCPSNSRG